MLMGEQTAKQAIDFLIANSRNRRHLELDFRRRALMNFDVVKNSRVRQRKGEAGRQRDKFHSHNKRHKPER